jgi:hypothetical protein
VLSLPPRAPSGQLQEHAVHAHGIGRLRVEVLAPCDRYAERECCTPENELELNWRRRPVDDAIVGALPSARVYY